MNLFHQKKIYLPALIIVCVVLLLLVFISISTYRNLNRDRMRVLNFMHNQGVTLMETLEALLTIDFKQPQNQSDTISVFIRSLSKNSNVVYFYVVQPNGGIRLYTLRKSMKINDKPKMPQSDAIGSRTISLEDKTVVYELAKPITFLMSAKLKGEQRSENPSGPSSIAVLGLNMTVYDAAQNADLNHAAIMAAIVVALGAGALFFIYVIQNYYLVDKTLQQTKDYTNLVVENMANGLLSIDSGGIVLTCNALALKLLDFDEKEMKGSNLMGILDFDAVGIKKTLNDRVPVIDREFEYKRPAGNSIPLGISVTPLESPQDNPGAVILLRDLTEIKRLQDKIKRSERLAAIGVLAAGVAHEVRNPLSSVKGFAQFLFNSLGDRPEEKEYAGIMIKEVDRINHVVNDLLTLARPQTIEPVKTRIDVPIDHAIRLVANDAERNGVDISKCSTADLEAVLDANQMTQALLNLLLNALQAVGPHGTITIGAESDIQNEMMVVWVRDNGPGIDPAIQEKIFDPFFTGREKGTGLGLAIVQKIIADHNGEVKIKSPPEGHKEGSCISLKIPLQQESKFQEQG